MSKMITISSGFIDLGEEMRRAQDLYFKMAADRTGKYQAHQRTHQLRLAQMLERRFDAELAKIRAEVEAMKAAAAGSKTDEKQGSYLTELK